MKATIDRTPCIECGQGRTVAPRCGKCQRGGPTLCKNDGCDHPTYLDGECITCKFPMT